MTTIDSVFVSGRNIGGAYYARCCRKTASSTQHAAIAAARAAGKHFGVLDTAVGLKLAAGDSYYAVPAVEVGSGYVTAHDILDSEAKARGY